MRKLFSVPVLGWSFLAIGLIGNPWLVARYLTQDGSLGLHTRTAILVFEAIVIFWGMVSFTSADPGRARQVSYLLMATVITLAIVETGLQVVCFIKNRAVIDVRMTLSVYKNTTWGDQYWKEYKSTSFHYTPFILWNADEYHGKWINIDHNGLRKTLAPGVNAPAPKEIYVLGGRLSGESEPGMITPFLRFVKITQSRRANTIEFLIVASPDLLSFKN